MKHGAWKTCAYASRVERDVSGMRHVRVSAHGCVPRGDGVKTGLCGFVTGDGDTCVRYADRHMGYVSVI